MGMAPSLNNEMAPHSCRADQNRPHFSARSTTSRRLITPIFFTRVHTCVRTVLTETTESSSEGVFRPKDRDDSGVAGWEIDQ